MPSHRALNALIIYAEDLGRRNPGLEDDEVLHLCQRRSTRKLTKNTIIAQAVLLSYKKGAGR